MKFFSFYRRNTLTKRDLFLILQQDKNISIAIFSLHYTKPIATDDHMNFRIWNSFLSPSRMYWISVTSNVPTKASETSRGFFLFLGMETKNCTSFFISGLRKLPQSLQISPSVGFSFLFSFPTRNSTSHPSLTLLSL